MRQGSKLQELKLGDHWPKISILTTYKPGITNLRSIYIANIIIDQEAMKFLSMVPKFCNGIINFDLYVSELYISTTILDIVKSQPLERMKFYNYYGIKVYVKKIIDELKFFDQKL